MARVRSASAHSGFTLLETLVALLVLSLVAGVMTQALSFVFRIERTLEEAAGRGASRALRERWIRDALFEAQPGSAERGDVMRGDAQAIEFTTLAPPIPGAPGARRIGFELRQGGGAGGVSLWLTAGQSSSGSTSGTAVPGTPLLTWGDKPLRFSYQDRAGAWHEQWPPSKAGSDLLPAVVALRAADGTLELAVFNPTSPNPLPGRKIVEAL